MGYHNRNETKIQRQIQDYLRNLGAYEFKVHRRNIYESRYTRHYMLL